MLIGRATGVTQTPELVVTKGIGQLIIATTESYPNLTTETISAYVEKAGKNKDIVRDMLLKDFLLLGTYGEASFQSNAEFGIIAVIDLTEDHGYIDLGENESIKIQLRELNSESTYLLHGIEEPTPAKEILMYVRKTVATENINKDFDVRGYDLMTMSRGQGLQELSYTFDNGSVVKYTPFELECLQRSLDNIQAVNNNGTVLQIATDRYQLPLKGVTSVNIRKDTTAMLEVCLRIDEGDFAIYQSHNNHK